MIATLMRILAAARKCDPNVVELSRRWEAEDPADGQKKTDPVSCVRIQIKSVLFALVSALVYVVSAVTLLRQGYTYMPVAVICLVLVYGCYVVDKTLLKNSGWVFDNARQFVFAVWLAEQAHRKPFTAWSYDDECSGFLHAKEAISLMLNQDASKVAKLQLIPFEASKAAKMKSVWLWEKTLLCQLFPELPKSDGAYFPAV